MTVSKEHDPNLLSVIIAARNEAEYIGDCLNSLLAQDDEAGEVEVIVVANACTDDTVGSALATRGGFEARGWDLRVIEEPKPGKIHALNTGDQAAKGQVLVYLDADVVCDTDMFGALRKALKSDAPLYATGTLKVTDAQSWVTRQYARFWQKLPFVQGGAVGAGLFAVNRSGRARWQAFPDIISDDTYVRLNFAPHERIEVMPNYHWPMVEGLGNLIKVRRRQDDGVAEIVTLYPELVRHDDKKHLRKTEIIGLFLRDPVGFCVYGGISAAVRLSPASRQWARGR
jgi:glycosyltransferase involved in cell wall biosynthesis